MTCTFGGFSVVLAVAEKAFKRHSCLFLQNSSAHVHEPAILSRIGLGNVRHFLSSLLWQAEDVSHRLGYLFMRRRRRRKFHFR